MSRKIREIIGRKQYGFRKAPSEDLRVVPDKDIVSVPKTQSLLIKSDGNEGKIFETVGNHNFESDRPAIILGLGKGRVEGDYSFTALSYVDSVFLGALLTTDGSSKDTFVNASTATDDDGILIPNVWNNPNIKIRARGTISRGWLVNPVAHNEGAVVESLSSTGHTDVVTADHTLTIHRADHGTERMLNEVLGRIPHSESNYRFGGMDLNRHLLTYMPVATTDDQMRDVTPTSWHGAWARSCVQMPGDYIRANDKVLSNLMTHLPYFKEMDVIGFWQKGFRSSFWSKFSEDELRVMGELTHLGMSLRHGRPIRNLHLDPSSVVKAVVPLAASNTAISIAIDGTVVTLAKARGILTDALNCTVAEASALIIDASSVFYHVNTADDQPGLYVSAVDGRDVNEAHLSDFQDAATFGNTTPDQYIHIKYTKKSKKWELNYTSSSTAPNSKDKGWDKFTSRAKLAQAMSRSLGSSQIATADVDTLFTGLRVDSWVGSLNPFFVYLEDSNLGAPQASAALAAGRSTTSMECKDFFACVPGLEQSLSPALVEQEDVQPQARDITLEDLWLGISYLFESDTTNMAGRHWSSISKFVRDLSPDFKIGAIHDFRSGSARTDEAMIKAGYLLGHRRLDKIRLKNTDPVTSASFFTRPQGQRSNIVSLYDEKGFISETSRVDVVEDISDLSKRNFQTTQDFLEGQQSVGEAKTNVYHAQMMDGSEHNVDLEASLMSFGSWQHVIPAYPTHAGIVPLLNPHANCTADQLYALYAQFIRQEFPNTRSRDYGEARTGVTTFVPFNWTATWSGLKALCQTVVPAQASTTSNRNFTLQSRNQIHTLQTGESITNVYSNFGDYFLDLSITNPMRNFLDIAGGVYKSIKNATGGLPYKANITMQDLIEINLVKQVTLSTGSPALQQMLDAFMLYGMRSDNNIATLKRITLDRRLWDKNAHKRDDLYDRQNFKLVPMVLPKSMDPSDILSVISSTNVFLHDIGITGVDLEGSLALPHTAFRTIYSNLSQVDGSLYDLAITRPTEWFDLLLDSPTTSKDSLPASVKSTTSAPTSLVQYYPGLRYLNKLYDLENSDTAVAYAWHDGDITEEDDDVNGDGSIMLRRIATPFKSFRAIGLNIDNSNASLNSELGTTIEIASGDAAAPTNITDYLAGGNLADGTYFTVIDDRVVQVVKSTDAGTGVASIAFSPNHSFKQVSNEISLWTSASAAVDEVLPDHRIRHVELSKPTEFNLDVIGVIAAASRQSADENVYYQTRAPKYAFICPDTFDRDHQIMSLMYHANGGQRLIGPCSYIAVYGHDGSLVSSASEVMSLVGSGQKITGDKVASKDDSPVSADDTSEPETSGEDYDEQPESED